MPSTVITALPGLAPSLCAKMPTEFSPAALMSPVEAMVTLPPLALVLPLDRVEPTNAPFLSPPIPPPPTDWATKPMLRGWSVGTVRLLR